jgi:hypothetical protein
MGSFCRALIASLFAISSASAALAQDRPLGQVTPDAVTTSPAEMPPSRTGKERLGRKWMDEQRIDNCNVPIEKRGSRPRPTRCPAG